MSSKFESQAETTYRSSRAKVVETDMSRSYALNLPHCSFSTNYSQSHVSDQRISCRGCNIMFTRAAALMTHIEQNQCKVITLKDFQRERAERAIEKDAWAEMLDKNGGSTVVGSGVGTTSHQSSELDDGGGVSLLDSERPAVERDWQGIPIQSATSGSYRAPLPQATGHSITALSKYPALPVRSSTTNATKEQDKDLLDLNDTEDKMSKLSVRSRAWSKTTNPSKSLFPTQKAPTVPNQTDSAYDDLSEIAFNPNGSTISSALPPGPRPLFTPASILSTGTPTDPNAENLRIQADRRITKHTNMPIGQYWNSIREVYECPGQACARSYPTPDSFRDHLLSGAHAGGHVICPSCLDRFKTSSALLSHMESGGRGCNVRNSTNYNQVLREVTAGLVGTSGHLEDGTVRYMAPVDEGWDFPEERRRQGGW